ncbi:MAG: hypothetical protein R2754_00490 [Microthrixaceae bacterium]
MADRHRPDAGPDAHAVERVEQPTDTQLALAALAGSGLDSSRFTVWLGGLPLPGGLDGTATMVVKVRPEELSEAIGGLEADRRVAWVRRPERPEWFLGSAQALAEAVVDAQPGVSAEATVEVGWLVVAGAAEVEASDAQLETVIVAALAEGTSPSRVAKAVAAQFGVPKRRVYELVLTLRDRGTRRPPS